MGKEFIAWLYVKYTNCEFIFLKYWAVWVYALFEHTRDKGYPAI